MNLNDPIGDMITRIRNAQSRTKSKVSTPGSKLRKSVLDVLKSEGYIRDYSTLEHRDGRTEFEIELKYFDGAPVIRVIERVSKPGRGSWSAGSASKPCAAAAGPSPIRPCSISHGVSAARTALPCASAMNPASRRRSAGGGR